MPNARRRLLLKTIACAHRQALPAHAYFNGITMLLLLTGWLEDLQRDLGSLIGAG